MAFHIDILRYQDEEGSYTTADGVKCDLCEIDHTIDDCIERGWMSPEGIWLRQTVEPPDTEYVYVDLPCPDPLFGKDMGLKLVKSPTTGKWVADMGGGLLFK
jgi:hypothetical protein